MNLEKMIITTFIVLAACICFLYPMYNQPNKVVSEADPEYYLLAKTLATDFYTDKNQANKKYLNKVIEVSGYLKEITQNEESIVIVLKGTSALENIRCTLEQDLTFLSRTLTAGNLMIIRGECNGLLKDVMMVHCTVIYQQNAII